MIKGEDVYSESVLASLGLGGVSLCVRGDVILTDVDVGLDVACVCASADDVCVDA